MAIVYVGGQTAGRTNASSAVSVNFALTNGVDTVPRYLDLVVVAVVTGSAGGTPAMAITTPANYTAATQINVNATGDTSMNVSYKVMGVTPDTAVTIPGTGNNAYGEAYTIQVFRNVDTTTPMDATIVRQSGTGTGRPNPDPITPVTAGAWVVICGGGAIGGTGANYTAPANFTTNFLTTFGADTTDGMIGSGYWGGWTSGAVDPAAYTGGTTGAGDSWAAFTLALRPMIHYPCDLVVAPQMPINRPR